ncbi:MAG: GtrA family protein [Longispora sp.]|nr:GtrA family protein [Longispora sp. (in: high G+C Gram-positive bacteria)]
MHNDLATETSPNALQKLYRRFVGLVRELGKFGVVGLIAFAIDIVIYNLLLGSNGEHTLRAKVISTVIAATFAFLGNRFWTWRDRPKSSLHREYLLYFLFNAIGLGIALSCLWVSHYGLGSIWPDFFHTRLADNIAAQGFGLVFGTMFRFYAYRRWVFVGP